MTTKEAVHAMIDGKKVKRKQWVKGFYSYAEGFKFYNQNRMILNSFVDSDDWEIYEEPKPKQTVVIEKWLVTNKKRFDVAETSDIDAYLGEGCGWDKVKLLDTYEVEL